MEWLKAYLQGEKVKIKGLDRRAKLEYIWQYYKIWIIALGFFIIFLPTFFYHMLTTPSENWFYGIFANTYAEVGEGSDFWEGFVEYGGFDTKEKNVVFSANSYFDPSKQTYNQYFNAFVAIADSGTLDVITMERDQLQALGAYGRLMDLSNTEIAGDLAERYADRLIYATPYNAEYSEEPIPIGIDLSDTCLVTKYNIYTESCALGVSALSEHLDAVELFLEYVIEEDGAP